MTSSDPRNGGHAGHGGHATPDFLFIFVVNDPIARLSRLPHIQMGGCFPWKLLSSLPTDDGPMAPLTKCYGRKIVQAPEHSFLFTDDERTWGSKSFVPNNCGHCRQTIPWTDVPTVISSTRLDFFVIIFFFVIHFLINHVLVISDCRSFIPSSPLPLLGMGHPASLPGITLPPLHSRAANRDH